jgi:hypothetical protein
MPALLKLLIAAAKIAIPEGLEIYTMVHDTKTGKATLLLFVDQNATGFDKLINEIVTAKTEIKKPAIE